MSCIRYSRLFLIPFVCSFPVGFALTGMSYVFSNRIYFYIAVGIISLTSVLYFIILAIDLIIRCTTHVTIIPLENPNPIQSNVIV